VPTSIEFGSATSEVLYGTVHGSTALSGLCTKPNKMPSPPKHMFDVAG